MLKSILKRTYCTLHPEIIVMPEIQILFNNVMWFHIVTNIQSVFHYCLHIGHSLQLDPLSINYTSSLRIIKISYIITSRDISLLLHQLKTRANGQSRDSYIQQEQILLLDQRITSVMQRGEDSLIYNVEN